MSNTVRNFSDSGVEGMCVQKQVAGEVSLTPGAVISGWFPRSIFVATVYTGGVQDVRYLSVFFYPRKLGDPPLTTSELIAPLYLTLLLQSPSLLPCSMICLLYTSDAADE